MLDIIANNYYNFNDSRTLKGKTMEVSQQVIEVGENEVLVIVEVTGDLSKLFSQIFPPSQRFIFSVNQVDRTTGYAQIEHDTSNPPPLSFVGSQLLGIVLCLCDAKSLSVSSNEMRVVFGLINSHSVDFDFYHKHVCGKFKHFLDFEEEMFEMVGV
jgi:hypothetical protein